MKVKLTLNQANGIALANADSTVQVEFLQSFLDEMLSWGTWPAQVQMNFIEPSLTEEQRALLAQLTTDA